MWPNRLRIRVLGTIFGLSGHFSSVFLRWGTLARSDQLDVALHVVGQIAQSYTRRVSCETYIPQFGSTHTVLYISEDMFYQAAYLRLEVIEYLATLAEWSVSRRLFMYIVFNLHLLEFPVDFRALVGTVAE